MLLRNGTEVKRQEEERKREREKSCTTYKVLCVCVLWMWGGFWFRQAREDLVSLQWKNGHCFKKAYNPKKFDFPKRTESTDLFPRALPVHVVPKLESETESETATKNEADREIERQNEREISRLINLVCGYVLLCCGLGMLCSVVVGKCGVMAEQYSSFMSSGTNAFFLNSDANVRCYVRTGKWGTRAHQARVPQRVVFPYIFPKQCFGPKYFKY